MIRRLPLTKISCLLFTLIASTNSFSEPLYSQYLPEAKKIYHSMTLDEKIGQLIVPSYVLLANNASAHGILCGNTIKDHGSTKEEIVHACGLDQINTYHLGAVLSGGGPYFNEPTLQNWANLNALAKDVHDNTAPYDPIFLTGNDAVHGNMHVQGAVIFPHNIGLGVTHNATLVKKIGRVVGVDSLSSGFNWIYAPTIAVAKDLRWGRTYESFGQDPALVQTLGKSYIQGIQDIRTYELNGPLATAKHFLGDGATQYGFDEGDDQYKGDLTSFWKVHGKGYEAAVSAFVGSMMVSYSAIDGDNTRMHFGGKWDVLNKFKQNGISEAAFDGLVVSDWNGATRAAYFYNQTQKTPLTLPEIYAKSINAGVDMLMLGQDDNSNPFDPKSPLNFHNVGDVFNAVKTAYEKKLIKETRLEDAVTRILAVKLAMKQNPTLPNYSVLQQNERKLALQAAEESLVLLKNKDKTLPLKKQNLKTVVFVGPVNDLGLQNGGWTVNWQGQKGNQYFTDKDKITSGATTLAEGIQNVLSDQTNYYFLDDRHTLPADLDPKSTVAIALVSEVPYAEFMGDIGNSHATDHWYELGAENGYNSYLGMPQNTFLGLHFSASEAEAVQQLKQAGIKVITVVYSGRPLVLTDGGVQAPWDNSDSVVAAFLPGTLGGKAIANAIFGDYRFRSKRGGRSNTLTFSWPRNMSDVENHFADGKMFDVGYGLKS
jgi:beta-glucosidase